MENDLCWRPMIKRTFSGKAVLSQILDTFLKMTPPMSNDHKIMSLASSPLLPGLTAFLGADLKMS